MCVCSVWAEWVIHSVLKRVCVYVRSEELPLEQSIHDVGKKAFSEQVVELD